MGMYGIKQSVAFIKTGMNKAGQPYIQLVEGFQKDGKVRQPILHQFSLWDNLEIEEPRILERLKQDWSRTEELEKAPYTT